MEGSHQLPLVLSTFRTILGSRFCHPCPWSPQGVELLVILKGMTHPLAGFNPATTPYVTAPAFPQNSDFTKASKIKFKKIRRHSSLKDSHVLTIFFSHWLKVSALEPGAAGGQTPWPTLPPRCGGAQGRCGPALPRGCKFVARLQHWGAPRLLPSFRALCRHLLHSWSPSAHPHLYSATVDGVAWPGLIVTRKGVFWGF
jgi:hypothetical protein